MSQGLIAKFMLRWNEPESLKGTLLKDGVRALDKMLNPV